MTEPAPDTAPGTAPDTAPDTAASTGAGSSDSARLRRRMLGRDRDEPHRPSTPLELLVDLCFVVAVAKVAAELHHAVAGDHLGFAVTGYLMVFFAIWWAWMNFTWFASAFDADDLPYRLLTLLQMAGVLVLAAGVAEGFEHGDFTAITIGYVIMRIAMVGQWLRAAIEDPRWRSVCLRYAAAISVVQVGWIARLFLPETTDDLTFVALVLCELAVPVWAERRGPMRSWHPGHIAERYGLFTIIVLGECILAGTITVQDALTEAGLSASLLTIAIASLVLIFGLWWCYFARSAEGLLRDSPEVAFRWGYAHYFVFASVAAIGAGLQVVTEVSEHTTGLTEREAAFAVEIPLALFLLVLGVLQTRIDQTRIDQTRIDRIRPVTGLYAGAAIAALVLAVTADELGLTAVIVLTALVPAALVGVDLARARAGGALADVP